MFIKTERLIIRYLKEDDWKRIKEIWEDLSDSEFAQYDRLLNTDDENVCAVVTGWAKFNRETENKFFAICQDDTIIGYVVTFKEEKNYEIGYAFHSAYHGKGYAKESILALFDYFAGHGITKFSAGTAIDNIPSVLLLKALGFKQTGTEEVSFYKDAYGNDIIFEGGIFELTIR